MIVQTVTVRVGVNGSSGMGASGCECREGSAEDKSEVTRNRTLRY